MIGHYRESVELVEIVSPRSGFLPALHAQLERLAVESAGLSITSPAAA
jgi:hypothetical protein